MKKIKIFFKVLIHGGVDDENNVDYAGGFDDNTDISDDDTGDNYDKGATGYSDDFVGNDGNAVMVMRVVTILVASNKTQVPVEVVHPKRLLNKCI